MIYMQFSRLAIFLLQMHITFSRYSKAILNQVTPLPRQLNFHNLEKETDFQLSWEGSCIQLHLLYIHVYIDRQTERHKGG